jgi:hypothetical protein
MMLSGKMGMPAPNSPSIRPAKGKNDWRRYNKDRDWVGGGVCYFEK